MTVPAQEPLEFLPGTVVEVAVDDPDEELRIGDRGTILVLDALGDLHIRWDNGELDIWKMSDAETCLRVIAP